MDTLTKVKRLSATLYWVTTIVMALIPFAIFMILVADTPGRAELAVLYPGVLLADPLPGWVPLTVGMIGFLPVLAVIMVLWHMRALFQRFKRGEILTAASAMRILWVGVWVLVVLALNLIAHTLQVLALTISNPPGQKALSIAFGTPDLGLILAGGFLLVIGWVMREAAQVAEENRGFV